VVIDVDQGMELLTLGGSRTLYLRQSIVDGPVFSHGHGIPRSNDSQEWSYLRGVGRICVDGALVTCASFVWRAHRGYRTHGRIRALGIPLALMFYWPKVAISISMK
jgi:hypothetical protein